MIGPPELVFLAYAVSGILLLLLLILVYLIFRKIIQARYRGRMESFKEKYSTSVFNFIFSDEALRLPISKKDWEMKSFEEMLNGFSDVLVGEHEKIQIHTLAEIHLKKYYQKSLQSFRWSKRMNALYHIEDFRLSSLQEELVKMTERKRITKEELNHVLRILASFQYKGIYFFLTAQFPKLTAMEYRNILIKLDEKKLDEFILGFHQCSKELQAAILDVLGIKRELRYVSFVESVYGSYSGEVRLKALKTLAAIGYVRSLDVYLPLKNSRIWEERMLLAKLIGSLADSNALDVLKELLHDDFWWVRTTAGQAISSYPHSDKIFSEVIESSKDAFAIDMAKEWQEREEGGKQWA